jgi:hypothetical protein
MTPSPSPSARGVAATCLAALAALAACHDDAGAFLAYPALASSTQSLLVATLEGNAVVEVVALTDRAPIERALPSAPLTFVVLAYDRPLDVLGLAPGPVTPVRSGRSRALPTPRETFVTTVDTEAPLVGWTRVAEVPNPLAGFRIAPDDACATLAVAGYTALPEAGTVAFIERLDARTVRTITNDGLARRLGVGGEVASIPVTFTASITEGFEPNCSTRAARELWLAGAGGVWAARVDDDGVAVREIVGGPVVGNIQAIAVDPERPDDEAWVLSMKGTLSRISRGQVTTVYHFPDRDEPATSADVIWLGPGHVLATHGTSAAVVEIVDGVSRLEEPFMPLVALGTMLRAPDGTLTVGGEDGRFARRAPGRPWEELGSSGLQTGLSVIEPTATGFLFGADYGWVGEYRDGRFCELSGSPVHGFDVEHILPLDERLYAIAGRPARTLANGVSFVELR